MHKKTIICLAVIIIVIAGIYLVPETRKLDIIKPGTQEFVSDMEDPDVIALEAKLSSLNESNPQEDAIKAFNTGSTKFAGLWGEPGWPRFPSIPQSRHQQIYESKNCWVFRGTTDFIKSDKHGKLIDRAAKYAASYNLKMSQLIEAK